MITPDDTHENKQDTGDVTYVVQRGDTLAGVALKLGVTKSELKRANHMYGTISLMAGQILKVGVKSCRTPKGNSGSTANGAETTGSSAPVKATFEDTAASQSGRGGDSTLAAKASAPAEPVPAENHSSAKLPDKAEFLFTPSGWGAGPPNGSAASEDADPNSALRSSMRSVFVRDPSTTTNSTDEASNVADSENGARPTRTLSSNARRTSSVSAVGSQHEEDDESRPRTQSAAQSLLSLVNPSNWGFRERRDGSIDSVMGESARLGGAAGPEDGESEAATERRQRARSSVAEGDGSDPLSLVMNEVARSRAPSNSLPAPGLDSDITHILAGGSSDSISGPPESAAKTPLTLPGLVAGASTIVTHSTIARMEAALPRHYRGYKWYLLYSTFRDGASYIQFYSRIKSEEPTYVVVENMDGDVFGGFATSAWSPTGKYYGTGECFLFSLHGSRLDSSSGGKALQGDDSEDVSRSRKEGNRSPTGTVRTGFQRQKCGTVEGDRVGGQQPRALLEGEVTTHGWSGINTYFQYSDDVGVGMGGGGGSFGLFVGDDLLSGTTGTCDTFDNPPLCSREAFDVSQLEVWGFTTASTEVGARMERLRKTLRGRTTRPLG